MQDLSDPHDDPMALDFSGVDQKRMRALQKLADRSGKSFEDFALQTLLAAADHDEKKSKPSTLARLFGFRAAR